MIFPWLKHKKSEPSINIKSTTSPSTPSGDVAINMIDQGIMKAYIPDFLYKPPFGYPRSENLPLIRQTAKTPYVFGIVKSIYDEIFMADWEICPVKGKEVTPELEAKKAEIENFFKNPNGNDESFGEILKAITKDILEIDSGVIVKVFNEQNKLVQIFARDGATFLKNPDIYGYMGNREDIIEPTSYMNIQSYDTDEQMNMYNQTFNNTAAYYQYGWSGSGMPVPFGKREIVYFMQNPQSNNIYGQSPIALLSDILYTLIYGSMYNLDFYLNNNMPEGMMSIIGASTTELTAAKQRFEAQFRKKDENTGFLKRIGFRVPFTNHEVKFTPFQIDPKTMQVIEQQQWFTKIVWSCFGVTADEMGFTENSNKAVSKTQHEVALRKAIRPIISLIQYKINQNIIPEFETTDLEFKFKEYNLDEELKQYDLYLKQLQAGVVTAETIAEKEGIDFTKVEQTKQKEQYNQLEMQQKQADIENPEESSPETEPKDEKQSRYDAYMNSTEKKAILIKEVPDDIFSDLVEGDNVKVVEGTTAFTDKIGVIEKIRGNSAIVRFDNGVDIFNLSQLVKIDKSTEITQIKAENIDPDLFNNTDVEKSLMKDIDKSAAKLLKVLQKWNTN